MKKILILVLAFTTFNLYAQQPDSLARTIKDSAIDVRPADIDNLRTQKTIDDSLANERNIANLKSITEYQDKRQATQKRNALLRIGFGVALLVVLVIGLRRRSRQKKA